MFRICAVYKIWALQVLLAGVCGDASRDKLRYGDEEDCSPDD